MKYPLRFNADQMFAVHRGLELRIAECEKHQQRARSARSRDEWSHQLCRARQALLQVEEIQGTIGAAQLDSPSGL